MFLVANGAPGIIATDNYDEPNPYAAPKTLCDVPVPVERPSVEAPWLQRFIALQAIVMVVSLAVEAYSHESITISGIVFSLVGLAIAILARQNGDSSAIGFGVSAIALASLIVFLIHYNSWSPREGDRPITILLYVYASCTLPAAAWLTLTRGRSRVKPETTGLHPAADD